MKAHAKSADFVRGKKQMGVKYFMSLPSLCMATFVSEIGDDGKAESDREMNSKQRNDKSKNGTPVVKCYRIEQTVE